MSKCDGGAVLGRARAPLVQGSLYDLYDMGKDFLVDHKLMGSYLLHYFDVIYDSKCSTLSSFIV